MKIPTLLAAGAIALLLAWQFKDNLRGMQSEAERSAPATRQSTEVSVSPSPGNSPPAVGRDAPASLRGTEVDGRLMTDQTGRLIIDEQLLHLFDYFYSTVGEVTFEQASASIRQYLQSQLEQPALGQALDLLQDYIDYKTALADLEQQFPVVADLEGLAVREDAVQRLRASLFDPQAHQAFFGSEEIYNAFTLERLALLHDPYLSRGEAAERIEALRTDLPEDIQALLVPQIHQQLSDETAALQARGADPAELQALRLSLVGPEATERLETLDRERAQWQQRLDAFDSERQAILAFPGLAEQDKQAAIEALLQEGFDPGERLRVAALLDGP